MTNKIETGCCAIVRATGQHVQVGREYPKTAYSPRMFATDRGDYQPSELKRITQDEWDKAENWAFARETMGH